MGDPEDTLEQWKAQMQAEHEDAITNPDPDEARQHVAAAQK